MKLLKRSLVLLGCALAAAAAFTACELSLGGDDRANPYEIIQVKANADAAIKTFQVDDLFTNEGVVVTAVRRNKEEIDVTKQAKFSIENGYRFVNNDIENTKSVIVTYDGLSDEYSIKVSKRLSSIKIESVTVAADLIIYNPGVIKTFDYSIKAAYSDGTDGVIEADDCTLEIAEKDGKKGIKASYGNSGLSDFYTDDKVAAAVATPVVKSGDSIGVAECNTSWEASPDIAIPNGKTMVATFTNHGNGKNVWNNFLIEVLAGESGITLRADPFGWDFNNELVSDLDYSDVTNSVGTTLITTDLLNGKIIEVTAKNDGVNLTINCLSPDVEGWAMNYTVPLKSDTAKSSVNLHFNIDGSYLVFN